MKILNRYSTTNVVLIVFEFSDPESDVRLINNYEYCYFIMLKLNIFENRKFHLIKKFKLFLKLHTVIIII